MMDSIEYPSSPSELELRRDP